jgi:hypothetical protein
VHGADDLGACHVENLVAPVVTVEVFEGGVLRLEHRAHRSVGDDDAFTEELAQERWLGGHGSRVYAEHKR